MGGKGTRTLSVVARHAGEWNFSYGTVDYFVEKSAELDDACVSQGRDPHEIVRSMMLPFAIGSTDRNLQTHIDAHRDTFDDLPPSPDEWRDRGFIAGSPHHVVEQIGERIDAGASRFMLQQNALDDLGSVELLATEVLPHF